MAVDRPCLSPCFPSFPLPGPLARGGGGGTLPKILLLDLSLSVYILSLGELVPSHTLSYYCVNNFQNPPLTLILSSTSEPTMYSKY